MPQGLRHLFYRFLRATRGVALMEFAFVFPILMLLLLGALELGRAMIITQRVEKTTYALADVVSQYPPATAERNAGEINETQLRTNVFPQFSRIMGNYADAARQIMIITSVRRENDVVRIKWQIAGGGSFTQGVTSAVNGASPSAIGIGVKNTPASFNGDPEALARIGAIVNGENMIVVESFYRYQPIWAQTISAVPDYGSDASFSISRERTFVKRMYFRPRNGDLICLPETFLYPECIGGTTPGGDRTCATGECEAFGNNWTNVPCGGCVPNGSTIQSIGMSCRRYQCTNGALIDIGPGRNRCEEVASCI